MASRWARISDRIKISPVYTSPLLGYRGALFKSPGRWIGIGPVFIRLGSRSSIEAEDQDAEMIKPVQP